MPQLLIRCPDTNKLVDTGTSLDRSDFDAATLAVEDIHCSGCGKMHTWGKQDVVSDTWAWVS